MSLESQIDDLSDKNFKIIFEKIPVGIAVIKNFKKVVYVNDKHMKITGMNRENYTGKTWMSLTHPEDLEKDINLFNQFKEGKINGYTLEKRYMNVDGTYIWVKLTIHPLDMEGDDKYYIAILEDINERKLAKEELFESERNKSILLKNLPGIAYRCKFDKNWTMEFVSEGWEKLTGYKVEDLMIKKKVSFNDVIKPKYRDKIWNKWVDVVEEDKKFVYEYPIITANGEEKWVFEEGQPIYDEKGEVESLEGLIIDITERKNKEREIQYLYNHDYLTGLYNRRYLEKIKVELNQEKYHPLSIIICDINGLKLINDAFGQEKGDEFIIKTAEALKKFAGKNVVLTRTGGDDFTFILPNTQKNQVLKIVEKIKVKFKEKAVLISGKKYSINISIGYCTKNSINTSIEKALNEAEDLMKKRKILVGRSSQNAILASIQATMFEKSQETEEHAERLIKYSQKIGEKLELSQDTIDDLVLSANLHDLGKVGIDNQLLSKEGKLTEEEWEEIKKHPEIGYRIALSSPDIAHIAEYILSHHERWDGSGYPQGLKEEDIPLLSRILSIVDAYDAMTSSRPYNVVKSKEEAIEELRKFSGSQFDPKLVEIFIQILEKEEDNEN
jgi:diguanylate cyclase (GGDEF)-like protein/PAS domain S-box-containing protein